MNADIIALRAHLVAEAERAAREAVRCQRRAMAESGARSREPNRDDGGVWAMSRQHWSRVFATTARTATDAWLAADARLRALDGLLAAYKAQADAVELRRTGTYARGRWYTREEIAALMLAPCEGDACTTDGYFSRECLPCGLRRLGVAVRP